MKHRPYLSALLALFLVAVAVLLLATRGLAPSSRLSSPSEPTLSSAREGGEASGPETSPASQADAPVAQAPAPDAGKIQGRPLRPGEPLRIPAGQPIPELFPYEKERNTIQRLAATYDAKSIPELAAFLDHADPLVREAARNGLVQLSSPEAAPVLRAAAAKARNAEEAAALREAADFLSPAGPG